MAESLIPAEAVQAVIEGVDHESIERHGLDRPAILAILRAAAPFLAEAETARAKELHSRDDSNPRGPWCSTCTTRWPCRTWIALLPAERDVAALVEHGYAITPATPVRALEAPQGAQTGGGGISGRSGLSDPAETLSGLREELERTRTLMAAERAGLGAASTAAWDHYAKHWRKRAEQVEAKLSEVLRQNRGLQIALNEETTHRMDAVRRAVDAREELERARAALARVREVHDVHSCDRDGHIHRSTTTPCVNNDVCSCGGNAPCPTIAALTEEKPNA